MFFSLISVVEKIETVLIRFFYCLATIARRFLRRGCVSTVVRRSNVSVRCRILSIWRRLESIFRGIRRSYWTSRRHNRTAHRSIGKYRRNKLCHLCPMDNNLCNTPHKPGNNAICFSFLILWYTEAVLKFRLQHGSGTTKPRFDRRRSRMSYPTRVYTNNGKKRIFSNTTLFQ